LKNYQEIVKVFFQYVSLLRETPPQEWIFAGAKGLGGCGFQVQAEDSGEPIHQQDQCSHADTSSPENGFSAVTAGKIETYSIYP
jgi:secreted Zn-dependent insulinase-like peptidase